MSPLLLTLLTFGAGVATVAGLYSIASDLYLRDRKRVVDRVDDEFRKRQHARAQKSLLSKDLSQLAAETEGGPTIRQKFTAMVEQSGLDITPRKLITIAIVAALTLGVFGTLIRQNVIAGVVLGLIGFAAPLVYVQTKRNIRIEKLLSQLPDAFDLMGRVIRSGQTMSQALQAVADEFPQPIAAEFGYCFEQQNLGLPPEISMRDLARRSGLVEIQIFVMALLVQQQTGGNLAELLDKLSTIIRTRYKIRGHVKTLTAEGRMQAIILLALPPVLFVAMLFMNRSYALTLFEYPALIWTTLAFEGVGALWIRKIVNFDY